MPHPAPRQNSMHKMNVPDQNLDGITPNSDPMNQPTRRLGIRRISKTVLATISILLVFLLVIAASVYVWGRESSEPFAYHALQRVTVRPSRASTQGGLPAEKDANHNPKAPTVEFFIDFACPDCAELDEILVPTLRTLQRDRQINVQVHPIDFLDSSENDHYSKRTASAAMYIAEHEPNRLLDFTSAMLDQKFQSTHANGTHLSNSVIQQQAIRAGVSPSVAKHATDGTYDLYVAKATKYTTSRRDLFVDVDGHRRFSTPTIAINDKLWQYRQLSDIHDVPDALVSSIGLTKEQAGTTALPSIGAHGSALPIGNRASGWKTGFRKPGDFPTEPVSADESEEGNHTAPDAVEPMKSDSEYQTEIHFLG